MVVIILMVQMVISPESNYRLVLSTRERVSTSTLPSGWVNAGESLTKHDKKKDGQQSVKIEKKDLRHVDFSVNKKPEAQNIEVGSQLNPGRDTQVKVAALTGYGF